MVRDFEKTKPSDLPKENAASNSVEGCPICGGNECVRGHEPSRTRKMGVEIQGRQVCPLCRKLRRLVFLNAQGLRVCARCFGKPLFRSYGDCDRCGRTNVVITFERADGARICARCYHAPLEECIRCGKLKTVGMRTEEGPICSDCYKKTHPKVVKKCVRCGRERVVQQRTAEGYICSTCYQRTYKPPTVVCSRCGREGNAYKHTPEGVICARCYRTPSEVCVRCGEERPVKCRTEQGPLCSRCYQRVHKRPTRVCVRCGRENPVGKIGPDGPICIRCYRPPCRSSVRRGHEKPTDKAAEDKT